MQPERIEELQSAQIDFDADGAAEALAWTWTANECWSRRLIGDTPEQDRAIFEERLPAAREHVEGIQTYARKKEIAERVHADELAALRKEKKALQYRPLSSNIRREEQEIDSRIRALIDGVSLEDDHTQYLEAAE